LPLSLRKTEKKIVQNHDGLLVSMISYISTCSSNARVSKKWQNMATNLSDKFRDIEDIFWTQASSERFDAT